MTPNRSLELTSRERAELNRLLGLIKSEVDALLMATPPASWVNLAIMSQPAPPEVVTIWADNLEWKPGQASTLPNTDARIDALRYLPKVLEMLSRRHPAQTLPPKVRTVSLAPNCNAEVQSWEAAALQRVLRQAILHFDAPVMPAAQQLALDILWVMSKSATGNSKELAKYGIKRRKKSANRTTASTFVIGEATMKGAGADKRKRTSAPKNLLYEALKHACSKGWIATQGPARHRTYSVTAAGRSVASQLSLIRKLKHELEVRPVTISTVGRYMRAEAPAAAGRKRTVWFDEVGEQPPRIFVRRPRKPKRRRPGRERVAAV